MMSSKLYLLSLLFVVTILHVEAAKISVKLTLNGNEVYGNQDHDFEPGDTVNISCTKKVDTVLQYFMYIKFNGKPIEGTDIVSDNLTLSPADDSTTFTCALMQYEKKGKIQDKDKSVKAISVKFRIKQHDRPADTTFEPTPDEPIATVMPGDSSSQTDDDLNIMFLVIGGVVVLICVVFVSIVIIRLRTSQAPKHQHSPNYENFRSDQTHAETAIPHHPVQWSQESPYQTPADQTSANIIYAEPVQEAAYATPIPKHLRPGKNMTGGEVTYASIDFKSDRSSLSTNYSEQYATVGDIINSQVLPKHAGTVPYDNVFPGSRYVNSNSRESVEPAYAEAHFK